MKDNLSIFLRNGGIQQLNELQDKTLNHFQKQKHLAVYAPTGSGKTLSFLLPLLTTLQTTDNTALILTPTRELALQIESVWKSLKTGINSTVCYGGHSVKIEVNNLLANPQLIIATPGRLADHLRRENISLKKCDFLIIDEFDKCLELGFKTEVQWIIQLTEKRKHTIFTSATKLEETEIEVQWSDFQTLDFTDQQMQPDLQYYILPEAKNRLDQLKDYLISTKLAPTIVFCNYREEVDDIGNFLTDNEIVHTTYHGGMEQFERERSLLKFSNLSAPVLICTDLGSRGLDIPDVANIIHFGYPLNESSHTHRNGRTARMQKSGKVIYFAADESKINPEILDQTSNLTINRERYTPPSINTLYFSAGKKDKINKVDLIGFLCQVGGLPKDKVGKITVMDHASFVAVDKDNILQWIQELNRNKIKSKKVRIGISK